MRQLLVGLYRQPASALGASLFLLFLFVALIGPLVVPYGSNQQIVNDALQGPSSQHWFGTDILGRDVFSRVILGARDILALAGLGTLFAVIIGTSFGLLSGYLGSLFDEILMRLFDSLLAMPALLLSLLLLGTLGPSRDSVLVVIVIVYTPIVARVVRSVRAVRENRYGLLRGFFHGEDDVAGDAAEQRQPRLHSVTLTQDAYAVGRTLAELDLAALGAAVTRVRRRGIRAGEPGPETRFETGDVVVVLGEPDALEAAEIRLLQGVK